MRCEHVEIAAYVLHPIEIGRYEMRAGVDEGFSGKSVIVGNRHAPASAVEENEDWRVRAGCPVNIQLFDFFRAVRHAARRAEKSLANRVAIGLQLRGKLIDLRLINSLIVGSIQFHLIVIEKDLGPFRMGRRAECLLRRGG